MNYFYEAFDIAIQMILSRDPYLIEVVVRSLHVSLTAVLLAAIFGLLVGSYIATHQFWGKRFFLNLINVFMGLPPVFVGLVVYIILFRQGPIAEYVYLMYTPTAMIIAQFILAAPIIAGLSAAAIEEKHQQVSMTAKGIGATDRQAMLMTIREAKVGIVVAIAAAFGRIIAEVGAVTIVGGDIAGFTRVLTTAIVIETRLGNYGIALAFGLVLLALSFIVNSIIYYMQKK